MPGLNCASDLVPHVPWACGRFMAADLSGPLQQSTVMLCARWQLLDRKHLRPKSSARFALKLQWRELVE